jgi:hypothetical protein
VHHEICQLTAGWARALNAQLPYKLCGNPEDLGEM